MRLTIPMIAALLAAVAQQTSGTARAIDIPASVQHEHAAIQSALTEATAVAGPVGTAATALAHILQPHFAREEEIALPPLGLLKALAGSTQVAPENATAVLAMSEAMRRELPKMLTEHGEIRLAVAELRRAAMAAHDAERERLADELALHAQTEEEVLYPAAIVVGELIRLQRGG